MSEPSAVIWEPGMPLFDGLASVFSTCRRCHQLMVVIDPDEHTHFGCDPKPTKLESLAIGWRKAVEFGDTDAEKYTAEEIERLDNQPPKLHASALYYARWGWPVFPLRVVGTRCTGGDKCTPLCQCPKTPATQNGFKDATTDMAQIDRWWDNGRRQNNIGLATGGCFDVIDIDPRHGGNESFLELLKDGRLPEIHGVAVTASGGMHLYVKPTGKGNAAGFMPGIDFRGLGGYVVAAPSTLGPRGRSWTWMVAPSPIIKADK